MSNLFMKFKKSPKETSCDGRTPHKSPLMHSTIASLPQKCHSTKISENSSAREVSTDNTDCDTSMIKDSNETVCGSPSITIEESTPGSKYSSNKPPPLDITTRKTSLQVATTNHTTNTTTGPSSFSFIPISQSLDDLSSRTSGSSVESGCSSPVHRPSSPMLSALREAVDSVSNMDDFRILKKIGAGFFAEVYQVEHLSTNQIMVIKINHSQTSNQTKREVEVLKKLSHPNLLHYLGACVHNGKLHPLTEYIEGGTLEQLIKDETHPFPVSLKVQLSHDIARGMEYLHDNGLLHRDFNSHNTLLRKNGSHYTAVVSDFGLASRNPHKNNGLKRTQSVVGSPYWMAPEVINSKPYDEKADVFSYGIVLCEIISRKEADPDEIPRLQDFSLDAKKFKMLPEVKQSLCPSSFIDLACACTLFLPIERPYFPKICQDLSDISLYVNCGTKYRSESLPPTPEKRLSEHFPLPIH